MNEKKYNIIEKIKSVLIVVLSLSAILLLYFFWANKDIFELSLSDFYIGGGSDYDRSLYVSDVLLPSRMEVVKESGETAVIIDSSEYYGSLEYVDTFLGATQKFLTSGEVVLEEVPKEQYEEAYQFASVKCCFDYYLPGSEYLAFLGAEKLPGTENLGSVSEIGFVESAPDSLLIRDGENGKYYRIASDQTTAIVGILLANEKVQEMPIYYTMGEYMGEQVENDVMMPLSLTASIKETKTHSEIDMSQSERITELARAFFGNSFDFVRKMDQLEGRVTYMYGYAETVLILDKDGTMEYKSVSDSNASVNYFTALDTALNFLESHSPSRENETELPLRFYVKDARAFEDGARGYRFEFGLRYRDCDIMG